MIIIKTYISNLQFVVLDILYKRNLLVLTGHTAVHIDYQQLIESLWVKENDKFSGIVGERHCDFHWSVP